MPVISAVFLLSFMIWERPGSPFNEALRFHKPNVSALLQKTAVSKRRSLKLNRRMRLILFFAALALAALSSFAEETRPPFYKGMTVSCQTWGIEWQSPEMEKALD